MAKYQRNKGRRGEENVVNYWKDIFPNAKRHLEFQKVEADDGIDVFLDHWNVVQVKTGSQVPKKIYQYLEQIKPKDHQFGFVQMKRDRKDWVVVMYADQLKMWFAILMANGII